MTLLASASSKEQLMISIEKFYCGTKMEITEKNEIRRLSDGKILDSVHIVKKGQRYRFEVKK